MFFMTFCHNNTKFKYIYKRNKEHFRLDVHPRSDEYYREHSVFLQTLDGHKESLKEIQDIDIFDVSIYRQDILETNELRFVVLKKSVSIHQHLPWYFFPNISLAKINIMVNK